MDDLTRQMDISGGKSEEKGESSKSKSAFEMIPLSFVHIQQKLHPKQQMASFRVILKHLSSDIPLTDHRCLSRLSLQLKIYEALELLGDAFVCPVTGLLPLTSRHAWTTLRFPLLLLSQAVSHPRGFSSAVTDDCKRTPQRHLTTSDTGGKNT